MEKNITKDESLALAKQYLTPNYGNRTIIMSKGAGVNLWDIEGKKYTDFLSGIGVVNLGHCHPTVISALIEQVQTLQHCSNYYHIPSQIELASLLCENSFAERVFFCNSGAEANEAAIKTTRRFSKLTFKRDDRYQIVSINNSFHGRTMATLTATGQERIQASFEPLLDGFVYADYNNAESVKALITEHTCAVMLEPVQGEGGVHEADKSFLQEVRDLCDKHQLLLIYDEVQCGMGRTGHLFAYEHYDVPPDIVTLAKALGNGFPIGAMLTHANIGDTLTAGSHGTTFGGNPMACAAGVATLKTMLGENVITKSRELSAYFRKNLADRLLGLPHVKGLSGIGMMVGIQMDIPTGPIAAACLHDGLIVNSTANTVIRILPPLISQKTDCDFAVDVIEATIKNQKDK